MGRPIRLAGCDVGSTVKLPGRPAVCEIIKSFLSCKHPVLSDEITVKTSVVVDETV